MVKKKLPIGDSNFENIIQGDFYFVDKTLLIKEVLDSSAKVLLIPRPRRFGKTVNMDMLRCFFTSAKDNTRLFDGLAISRDAEMMTHLGKYPVVFISLKDVKSETWEISRDQLRGLIADLYRDHRYLLRSSTLDRSQKKIFESQIHRTSSIADLQDSLKNMVEHLARHHHQNIIVIIDEYDTLIHEAYKQGYYDSAISFMRIWFGGALKDQGAISKAVITGIMRVAKESLFSGLNNFKVYPIHRASVFSDKFGFTDKEVVELLRYYGRGSEIDTVREWYNGYRFGKATIYNPWSIVNYIDDDNGPLAYWLNSSSNEQVYEILGNANSRLRCDLELLMAGSHTTRSITDATVLRDNADPKDIWSYLLASGYITAGNPREEFEETVYDLWIPNKELRTIYIDAIRRWLDRHLNGADNRILIKALLAADWPTFERLLSNLVMNMLSYHNVGADKPEEVVIQAFILGILSGLTGSYQIRAEREEGLGRADIVINPFDKSKDGFVIELKTVGKDQDMDKALNSALAQIDEKKYAAGMESENINPIHRLAIVLRGKTIQIKEKF